MIKTAQVYEEVGLRKELSDRVETVRDTVRKETEKIIQVARKSSRTSSTLAVPRPQDPTLFLNFRLDILSSEAMKAVDGIYRRECGLDVRHLRILRLIGFLPGVTFSQLAEETRLERALTSRIVTALTAKGLVERHVSGIDARQFYLHLSADGVAVRDRADALGNKLEDLLLSPLTVKERTTMLSSLDKLIGWVRQGGGLETLNSDDK